MIQPSFSSHVIGGSSGGGRGRPGRRRGRRRRSRQADHATRQREGSKRHECIEHAAQRRCRASTWRHRPNGRMIACGRRPPGPGDDMPFRYIAIEGPIGVGKTALAERLATRLDATTVLEETENPFLADFYAGRAGAALQAQLFYLLNRHRQQIDAAAGEPLRADHDLRLPVRQGQDLRVSEPRRQRAVHLPAALRPARRRTCRRPIS